MYNAEETPSPVIRTRVTATDTQVEFDYDLSINGGAFTTIADTVRPYDQLGGTGPSDHGRFDEIRLNAISSSYRSHDFIRVSVVPEPTSLAMLGLGCMFLGARPWRRRQRK